mgnify:CR=1 FL=1
MSKIEILAPVGNEEMLRAAVFSGADAVYLGFSGFNARTSANNFNADTLKDADTLYREPMRPLAHITPMHGFMNDPNGLFYL